MNLFDQQSVLLVGLGESGLACARWALAQGAALTIIDSRSEPPGLSALANEAPNVRCVQTVAALSWTFDRVVVSPGLPPAHPLMTEIVALAHAHNTPVESELDWFADALVALAQAKSYHPKVIGVTGTNGKTTTVRMVECLARFAGAKTRAAGNISPAALASLLEAMNDDDLPDVWVLELSSFQLHWTSRLTMHASAVLNLTQDHLDWHADAAEYANDKARIFNHSKVAVINRDDAVVRAMETPETARTVSFGLNAPTSAGDFGLIREGGMLWLSCVPQSLEAPASRRRKDSESAVATAQLLMPADALQVVGLHNAGNALAALALCQAIDLPMAKLLHGLRTYKGEPHRVQWVAQVEGVDYFDDSKGTNVGATVAALQGLQRPCVLIAGGEGKGQDFSDLLGPVRSYACAVVLIGKAASELHALFNGLQMPVERCESLEDAVANAHQLALEHAQPAMPCVLLSPACASLDMFKNYVHRAEVFVSAVQELAFDRGQPC